MRRGQIFSLDIVIALVILIIGVAVIYYETPAKNKSVYDTERMSEDVISVLQATKLTDLCINPGTTVTSGCDCRNYVRLEAMVCDTRLINKDADLISFMTELIETRRFDRADIYNLIREIFVEKNVIDEKRYGFAIVYTIPEANSSIGLHSYELYNTENPP